MPRAQRRNVIGVNLSTAKVAAMEAGRSPIVETRVSGLMGDGHKAGRLRATCSAEWAVLSSDISFLCLATPSLRNGKRDLGHVQPVYEDIGRVLKTKNSFHLVVARSTMLPGTTETIVVPALKETSGKKLGRGFAVWLNPEFMREGTAVADFLEEPRLP